jgi:molecular chaperone GrpE
MPQEARMRESIAEDEARTSGEGAADKADAAALQAENASLRDRMLRALADAENTRRRAERTARDATQYAVADFARELLPVVDNLQRSIAAADAQADAKAEEGALMAGVRAVEQILMRVLESFGVRRIDALGKPFDPARHEAMMEVDDASAPGTVVRVVEDGYMVHDRLLRPARVVVAGRRAGASPSSQATAGAEVRSSGQTA